MTIVIERATAANRAGWCALRTALWPDADDHADAIDRALATTGTHPVWIAIDRAGDGNGDGDGDGAVGLAEAALRHDYVNGCETSPVLFLEGLYVSPERRGRGIARALVAAMLGWAHDAGVAECASDALLDNRTAHAVHAALGFVETERVVYFKRETRA